MMDTLFEIAVAGSSDEQDIIPLMASFNGAEGIPWRPALMGAALQRLLCSPDLGFVMIVRDRASRGLAGYGVGTFGYDLEFGGRDAFVTELFIETAFRRRGLGAALLDAIVEELRRNDAAAVHLMVQAENARARGLYESRGFCVTERISMTKLLAR